MLIAFCVSLGVAGGTMYSAKGGGTNYQCLPWDPEWGRHTDGLTSGAYMHGAEYDVNTASSPILKVLCFLCIYVVE